MQYLSTVDEYEAEIRKLYLRYLPPTWRPNKKSNNRLLLTSLKDAARAELNLKGALQLSHYGFNAGLIFDLFQGDKDSLRRREQLMNEYRDHTSSSSQEREVDLRHILSALLTGQAERLPKSLMFLFTMRDGRLCGIFYQLEFYFLRVELSKQLMVLTQAMADMCKRMLAAGKESGMHWQTAVSFVILIRCVAWKPDGLLVPDSWFTGHPLPAVRYNPYNSFDLSNQMMRLSFDECKHLSEIIDGIDNTVCGPLIDCIDPNNAKFKRADFAVRHKDKSGNVTLYAYQIKVPNKRYPGRYRAFQRKFYIVGSKPPLTERLWNGWTKVSLAQLADFLGWTFFWSSPRELKAIADDYAKALTRQDFSSDDGSDGDGSEGERFKRSLSRASSGNHKAKR
jgi:hypothetical protein